MTAQPGQVYGPYRVIRPLGGGGMGTVLLAEDPRLGRFVALKTFAGEAASTPQGRDHLLREARAAARLSHPNIAAVHDVLDIEGELVIVFEYVEGETLAARLRRGRLAVADALHIAQQLADGLAAAHAQGVIHRDLKPANVMLMHDGRAKILDFGIAHSLSRETEETSPTLLPTAGLYAGTPAYAAPEQWLGEPLGPYTDVFALGLVLFEMLGGRRPFDAESRLALMQQVIEAPRPRIREINPHVPPSVDALIHGALAPNAAQRPPTARDVANVLHAIEHDVGTVNYKPAGRIAARVGPWSIAAIVVLIAVIAALVATLGRSRPLPGKPPVPVVAVLPLSNMTGSAANEYLTAGIADSLTTSLASLDGITVLSRAGVMGVWGREKRPSELAKELGASYLVEGAVQQAGDRVRLSINLVRPDNSVQWAESVEGVLESVFELQSRLAASLGRALSVQLSAAERAKLAEQPTGNRDALSAYWRGRALLDRRDVKGNTEAALGAFDQAVRLDPNFAIAHAARGEALWFRYVDTREPSAAQEAIAAGYTALRLDPNRANVRYSLAVSLAGSGRLDEAIDELQRALALQPNYDDARRELGNALAVKGRLDEAVVEYRKAIELRPNFWGHYSSLGVNLYRAARYDEAIEAFKKVIELQPDNYFGYQQLGTVYQAKGDDERAMEQYQRANSIRPSAAAYANLGAIYHRRGLFTTGIAAYQESIKLRPNAPGTFRNLGDAYARVGRVADARAAYREAIRLTEAELKVNPNDAVNVASLAVYYAKAGDRKMARETLERAQQFAPANVQVLVRAAQVDAIAGDRAAALDALERAVAAGYSRKSIADEEEFAVLKNEPRFQALVAESPAQGGVPR
jgi:eukaryotic-like serine/threonine-protein kinase